MSSSTSRSGRRGVGTSAARLLSGSACNDTVSTSRRATERAHAPSVDDDARFIPEQRELLWSVAHELRAPLTALTTA